MKRQKQSIAMKKLKHRVESIPIVRGGARKGRKLSDIVARV